MVVIKGMKPLGKQRGQDGHEGKSFQKERILTWPFLFFKGFRIFFPWLARENVAVFNRE